MRDVLVQAVLTAISQEQAALEQVKAYYKGGHYEDVVQGEKLHALYMRNRTTLMNQVREYDESRRESH